MSFMLFLLLRFLRVEVDGDTPTPIDILVLNSHESAGVQEWQHVLFLDHDASFFLFEDADLLAEIAYLTYLTLALHLDRFFLSGQLFELSGGGGERSIDCLLPSPSSLGVACRSGTGGEIGG